MTELWKRQVDGYSYEQNEDGTTGQEIYIRHDDAAGGVVPGSLPVPGSSSMLKPNGSADTSCVCRTGRFEYLGADINTGKWTFMFDTKHGGGSPQASISNDEDDRSFSMGGEVVSVDANQSKLSWKWAGIGGGSEPVRQPVSKFVITGAFSIPKVGMSDAEFATWFAHCKAAGGKINNAAFEDGIGDVFAPGQVLFSGIDGGTYTNEDGEKKWKFAVNFDYRVINDTDYAGQAIWSDDWRYLFATGSSTVDPEGVGAYAGWDKPYTVDGGAGTIYLFAKANLQAIL